MKYPSRSVRVIALFFLTDVLLGIAAPTVSYALTTGPNQTEFTSYEPIGTTDMVNLASGDFTYNVPLIDIPSPEGGFSLPLSYHSGVGLEDEASWAGLGWNVNPGAISRNKVSSADDDYDNYTSINVQDPGGSGYVQSYVLYQRSWDSEKGYGGAINLFDVAGFSWNDHTGLEDGTVMGVTFNKDKATFSMEKFFNGLTTVASMGATSSANAAVRAGTRAASVGSTGAAATKAIALGKAEAFSLSASTGMNRAMTGLNLYNGYKSQGSQGSVVGNWNAEKSSSNWGFRQDYKYWLDNTSEEHSYGALYLGQMKNNTSVNPSSSVDDIIVPRVGNAQSYVRANRFPQSIYHDTGTPALTSDMYSYVEPGANYAWSFNPTHVAYDAYSVMGPSIGGSMAPYRPEVGSLVFPKKLNNGSNKINLVPFLEEGVDIDKVQFKYSGDLSNSYTYHDSGGAGMSIAHNGNNYNTNRVYYSIPDPKLAAAARTEADRDGLYSKRLAQGKHVQWFSNQEMASDAPSISGQVMEYKPLNDPTRRSERSDIWPVKGIGAYSITNSDGTTYHYALPVYNKMQEDFTGVAADVGRKFARSKSGDFYSRGANGDWYATTWLLTGITGSDFVDRGDIGSIDAADQGYWVKFDYGRFANFYQWRFPYTGYTPDGNRSTYSKGIRETYYLNTIQTRTHTALFLKDIRKDGRGAYRLTASGSIPQWATPEDNIYPASSLALSEIVLLNNADYQQLQASGFTKNSATGATIDQTQLQAPASAQQASTCSLSDVYDVYDVQDNAAFRSFINQKAQRKITLNTSYTLCPGTTNSFASATNAPLLDGSNIAGRLGKLTLNSLSYYGPNNVKLFPDFKFQYNSPNPAYNKDSWDGWGSYNATGATSHYSASSDPTVWHLTDIISPLGGRVSVAYEADDYSAVSGLPIKQRLPITGFQGTDATHGILFFDLKNIAPFTLHDFLSNGATTILQDFKAQQSRRCWHPTGYNNNTEYNDYNISPTQQVQGVRSNGFEIARPRVDGGSGNFLTGCPDSQWYSATGYLEVTLPTKRGGGVRVASLTVHDEGSNAYRTGYLYTQSGQRGGTTSGVVAQEPPLVKTFDYPFYNLYDFPNTPVLYSKVTVVEGMKSDTDYTHKAEYTFNTPTQACVSVSSSYAVDNLNWGGFYGTTIQDSKLFNFDVQNHSSRVGRIESIKTIDNATVTTGQIDFGYTEQLPNNQGKFTSGSMMCEVAQGPNRTDTHHFKLSRTTKTAYPNVLTSVRTTSNGVTSVKNNTAWDFLTGVVLQEDETHADGATYQTTTVPAYVQYPQMRSKAENIANKHMLDQSTASYTYKLNSSRVPTTLLSAGVQTWNKDWTTYRQYNATTDRYVAETSPTPVWRKHKSYRWANNRQGAQGGTAIADFMAFNWVTGASQTPNWYKDAEIMQYDHFSAPLEVKDLNGDFVARKYGHNQTQVIAQAINAKYTELAYSGAEDVTSWGHFGGEVRDAGLRVATPAAPVHTGTYSSKLAPGQNGFTYTAAIGPDVVAGRTYRVSAWLHGSDLGAVNGRIYARLNNTMNGTQLADAHINSTNTKKAGNWYLLSFDVALPAGTDGQTLTVGCQNLGSSKSNVYFDDFRFHPLDSPMKSYVYDPQSWQTTYILDGDNLFTHYQYDIKGNLYRIYKEVLDRPNEPSRPERIVKEYASNLGRNATFTVQASALGTGLLGSSQPGGLVNVVEVGDEVRYTATSTDCHSLFNMYEPSAITIDGTAVTANRTLSDGAQVQPLADGCQLSNVRGPHSVVLQFTTYVFEPAGTEVDVNCEVCASTGLATGYVLYHIADGCGGTTKPEYDKRYGPGECPLGSVQGPASPDKVTPGETVGATPASETSRLAAPIPEECAALRPSQQVKKPASRKSRVVPVFKGAPRWPHFLNKRGA